MNEYDIDEIIKLYECFTNSINNNDKEINNKEIVKICSSCKSDDFISDYIISALICCNCGLINKTLFDMSAEKINYNDDKNDGSSNGCAYNPLLPQSSMGTTISGRWTRMKVLQNWNAVPYKERSLSEIFKLINIICSKAGILKCVEDDAKIMFKIISDIKNSKGKNNILRGNNRMSIIAAALFFACKKKCIMKCPKEIAQLFNIQSKKLTRGCKLFNKLIEQEHSLLIRSGNQLESNLIRIGFDLNFKDSMISYGVTLIRNIIRLKLFSSNTPLSICVSCILLIIKNHKIRITKKILSKKYLISEVTIIKTFKKIEQYEKLLKSDHDVDIVLDIINKKKEEYFKNLPENLKMRFNKFNIQLQI
jgi:transcription initiation factor TFIIIB Brf1 subunit/transcription initiation factor TFIIB